MTKEEEDFLEEHAGEGLNFSAKEKSQVYLSLVQPDSGPVADGATPGVWRNSATGEEYGSVVNVVVLAFKTVWNERDDQPPYSTIMRYEPGSIPVNVQQPKNGKGYPKLINADTGREIQELFMYAVALPEKPEAGVLLLALPAGSMKACRAWNTQLDSQLLSSGKKAPIFAFTWDLACALVENPNKKGSKITKFVKAQKGSKILKETFDLLVKPQRALIEQEMLNITADPGIEASAE